MYNRNRGFTLIELIVVLAIAGILSGLMLPSLSALMGRHQSTSAVNRLVHAINFTRHAAVQFRIPTTLCAAKSDNRCGGNWHEELIVFSDSNKNARMDGRDYLIRSIEPVGETGTVKWRSFRNRQYLQMTPRGYTNFQNGNFVYCPADEDPTLTRQVIINMQGRVRVLHARNKEGVPVDRHGKQLRC